MTGQTFWRDWLAQLGCFLRKQYAALFVGLFLGLLLLPLVGFRGSLADFSSSFWGYDPLLKLNLAARFSLFKDQLFGDVIAVQPNWLIYTGEGSLNEFQNAAPFSEKELETIHQNLEGLNTRLGAQGIHLLVVVVPGKNTIYPETMPAQVGKLGDEARLDQVLAYERAHQGKAKVLDLRPALLSARQERQIYYATDTHWNPYGILVGYQEIIASLAQDFPNLKAHTLDDFKVVSRGQGAGDLSRRWMQNLALEEQFRLEPRFKRQTVQMGLGQGNNPLPGRMIGMYNPDASLPRAVVIHDSFFNDMIPFLSDHFSWAVYDWAFRVDENFVAGEKPDIVIYELTDRYLERLITMVKQ